MGADFVPSATRKAADGTTPMGNGSAGVLMTNGSVSNNQIGGTGTGEGNVIAYNGVTVADDGVEITSSPPSAVGNSILGNSIHHNALLGISLQAQSTPLGNDPGDGDTGPNSKQNYPVLDPASAWGGTSATAIAGSLNSTPNTTFRLEFFGSSIADPSGFGEGEKFLGSASVTTDGAGDASFVALLPTGSAAGDVITATVTNPAGSTSEFSGSTTVAAAVDIQVAESVGAGDSLELVLPVVIHIADGIGALDAVLIIPPVIIEIGEGIGAGDNFQIIPPVIIEIGEGIGAVDSVQIIPPVIIQLGEGIGISDTPQLIPTLVIQLGEGIGTGDAVQFIPTLVIQLGEGIGTGDAVQFIPTLVIQLDEVIGTGDAVQFIPPLVIQLDEVIGAGDFVLIISPLVIQLTEPIGAGDLIGLADFDGIDDPIDGFIDESDEFVDESGTTSNNFTDQHIGGTSFGAIVDRGGLLVTVSDESNPDGMLLTATGGPGTATFSACSEPQSEIFLTHGDSLIVSCGSLITQVISGPVEILLEDQTVISVPSGTSITISELTDGEFVIENTGSTAAVIEVDGAEVGLEPDEIIEIDEVVGTDLEVELHIIDQFKSGACPGGQGSCKFPVSAAEVLIFDRNDPAFQDAFGGKNPNGNIYDQVFESGIGQVGGCTISPVDAGSCTAGTTAVGENLTIVRYVVDENTTAYIGRPGTQRGLDNSGKSATRFQIIKGLRKTGQSI